MNPGEVYHPDMVQATCVKCGKWRNFHAIDADTDDLVVFFECEMDHCDNQIRLDLSP